MTVTNQDSIHKEIKSKLNLGTAWCPLKNIGIKMKLILSVLYGCEIFCHIVSKCLTCSA